MLRKAGVAEVDEEVVLGVTGSTPNSRLQVAWDQASPPVASRILHLNFQMLSFVLKTPHWHHPRVSCGPASLQSVTPSTVCEVLYSHQLSAKVERSSVESYIK